MRRRTSAMVLTGSMVLVAGCSSGHGDSEALGQTPRPSSAAPGGSPANAAREPITLAFAGDTNFDAQLGARLANRPATAMGPIAKTLKAADFTMVNLETAITTGGVPAPGKQFHFRAPATAFTALKAAGVDVVTMANNHGMDYGAPGLKDSLAAIRKTGFPVVGIGKDADAAYSPYTTTVKGNRLAVIGATQVLDDQLIQDWTATDGKGGLASAKVVPRLVKAVEDARKNADVVIVYLHWGQEMRTCPLPVQQELAARLVDSGADIVVGGHAHVLLGGGYLKGKYVDYGLGNFHFASASGKTTESGVLKLTWDSGSVRKANWLPAQISGGLPLRLKGPAAVSATRSWTGLRACTGLSAGRR